MPRLLSGLVDDAAVFPPGNAPLPDAVTAHRTHRTAWYADMVGPLLLPASEIQRGSLRGLVDPAEGLVIGLVGDTGLDQLPQALDALAPDGVAARQIEAPVAKRGEDPQPGLSALMTLAGRLDTTAVYAEIPLTFGLMGALDALASKSPTVAAAAGRASLPTRTCSASAASPGMQTSRQTSHCASTSKRALPDSKSAGNVTGRDRTISPS